MKKILALAVSIAFTGSLLTSPAFGAVKAGATCSKTGSTSTSSGKKYTCIKSGKKLVWDKGVLISNSVVQLQVSPLTTPVESTSPKPQQKDSFPTPPTNFSDLFEHRSGIAYGAWSKTTEVLKNQGNDLPIVDVYKGPNTSVYVKDPRVPLQFVAHLFPSFELPKKVVIIYWTNQDMGWATTKATEIMGSTEMQKVTQETGGPFVDCYTPTNCNVGHAHIAADGTAYIGLGNPDHAEGDPNFPKGQKEEIEFYHALQLYQYFKHGSSISAKGTITSPNFPPAWINIPGENFTFDAFRFEGEYKAFAAAQDFSYWMGHIGHIVSPEWLAEFLDIKNLNSSWSDDGFATVADNNCFGASIVEIFVALKGPSVLLNFHDQMSQGKTFQEAFKIEFGASWEEAAPIISKVIYDKYQNHY
jgi:hypothetical protein